MNEKSYCLDGYEPNFKVCEHIRINLKESTWGEYGNNMTIKCLVCNKLFEFDIDENAFPKETE